MLPNPELQGVYQILHTTQLHILGLYHNWSIILANGIECATLIQLFLRTVVKTPTVLLGFGFALF